MKCAFYGRISQSPPFCFFVPHRLSLAEGKKGYAAEPNIFRSPQVTESSHCIWLTSHLCETLELTSSAVSLHRDGCLDRTQIHVQQTSVVWGTHDLTVGTSTIKKQKDYLDIPLSQPFVQSNGQRVQLKERETFWSISMLLSQEQLILCSSRQNMPWYQWHLSCN